MTDYCSSAELKAYLRITDTDDDVQVARAVSSASRWVDQACGRAFASLSATTRTYAAVYGYCLDVDDLQSVTTLKTDDAGDGTFETTWTAADFQLLPVNPAVLGETWPYSSVEAVGAYTFPVASWRGARRDRVQIVGSFGWAAVPAAVQEAALLKAAANLKRRDAPFGVAGFGDLGVVRVRTDPEIASLLAPYRKTPVMVA